MITLFSRQRKSSPKVAVAVAIPYKEKQFYDCWERQSDFLDGLKDEWGTSDAKTFWLKYSNIARTISIALVELKKDGVEILDEFGERDFEKVVDKDIIIFIAHKCEWPIAIELWDGLISIEEFANKIPENFKGTIDITCCTTIDLLEELRIRCKEHDKIIAPFTTINAIVHPTHLPFIIKRMKKNKGETYIEALKKVYEKSLERRSNTERAEEEQAYLGGNKKNERAPRKKYDKASLIAPRTAAMGSSFLVQLYIHKNADSELVKSLAHDVDEDAVRRVFSEFADKLRKGDEIRAKLIIENNKNSDFSIESESDVKSIVLPDGSPHNITFRVFVSKECHQDKCSMVMRIFVAGQRELEMLFDVKIVPQEIRCDERHTTDIEIRNHIDFRNEAIEKITQVLKKNETKITERNHERLRSYILETLNANSGNFQYNSKNIFICSTHDLEEVRALAKDFIAREEYAPVTSDHWSADDDPVEILCIRKVLESELILCFIGKRYGSKAKDIDLSMTELEFYTAMYSGKYTIVLIDEDARENSDEEQRRFINDIEDNWRTTQPVKFPEIYVAMDKSFKQYLKRKNIQ